VLHDALNEHQSRIGDAFAFPRPSTFLPLWRWRFTTTGGSGCQVKPFKCTSSHDP